MHVMANPRFALSSTSCEKPLLIQTWHQRLGHLNYSSVKALSHLADGIRISKSPHDQELCIACLEGKFRQTYRKQPSNRAAKKLELIHSDSCGPFPVLSITGSKYFILYIDDLTRMIWVYFLKSKGAAETLQTFQNFKVLVEKSGDHKIRRIRCDNGKGEYDNERFRGYLIENGITYEPSAPYTQNQNGVSERMIRTIVEKARSMLHDVKLGESFWEEAV